MLKYEKDESKVEEEMKKNLETDDYEDYDEIGKVETFVEATSITDASSAPRSVRPSTNLLILTVLSFFALRRIQNT